MIQAPRASRRSIPGAAYALLFLALLTPHSSRGQFAPLQPPIEWRLLDHWQGKITRAQFEGRLPTFSPDGEFKKYLEITDAGVTVYRTPEKQEALWKLDFAPVDTPPLVPFSAASLAPLSGVSPELPLAGKTICLDPGHIGGEWANIEERRLKIGRNPPVQEGDMTLQVCRHLEPLLRAAGAEVVWARNSNEPTTPLRPDDLELETLASLADSPGDATLQSLSSSRMLRNFQLRSERLFYRTAEIIARAGIVSRQKPDLTICVHYNAAPATRWQSLFRENKLVLFVHGSYTRDELADEHQQFQLLSKLLENSTPTELAIASSIADEMKASWGLPPENYESSESAHRAGGNPYVWSRNLLANRLYPGPVVFIEGPYMNNRDTFKRMIEGDYEGERKINEKSVPSLHREYAEAIAKGVINHYREPLPSTPTPSLPE